MTNSRLDVKSSLPRQGRMVRPGWDVCLEPFPLGALFDLIPGDFHSLTELPPGYIPVVSCGDRNNGIAGYRDVRAPLYQGKLTIALNGSPLATKYHPYAFAAKDDVAVCIPKHPLRLTTLLFVQVMLNMERWRYSYYRKCYLNKLRRFCVSLPAHGGDIDEGIIEAVVQAAPYWDYLSQRLHAIDPPMPKEERAI